MKISIIIPTLNEEKNINECLKSIGDFADEIVVVDMYSTDKTVEMAKKFGAKVFQYKSGDGEIQAIQTNVNLGIEKATGNWLIRIDADERLTNDFKKEVKKAIETKKFDAYLISRKQWFIDGFITGGDWSLSKIVRIFRKGVAAYNLKNHVHEKLVVIGRVGEIKSPLLHYSHRDLATVLHRFNQYTDAEAKDKIKTSRHYLFDMIFWPNYVFWRNIIIKRSWRDGTRGMVVLLLWCFYQFLSYAKAWEKSRSIGRV